MPSWPGHDGGAWMPVPVRAVATWPTGSFAENLAVAGDGTVFVSLHSHNRIDRYRPDTGALDTFCELPAPATGLALDQAGMLWVTGGQVGHPPGLVWRVDPDGHAEEWIQIPDALFLNGCAVLPTRRLLLVAESLTGRVLAVDQCTPTCSTWAQDGFLAPEHSEMPGANGIKLDRDSIWLSVTDRNTVGRIPIEPDGQAGSLEVVADALRADDFAFAQSGAMYIATHVAQTVVRLHPDGTRTTVAGPDEGAVGSTACAFGRASQDHQALYVTTNGGLSFPYEGRLQEAKLLRLAVGEIGRPLPGVSSGPGNFDGSESASSQSCFVAVGVVSTRPPLCRSGLCDEDGVSNGSSSARLGSCGRRRTRERSLQRALRRPCDRFAPIRVGY